MTEQPKALAGGTRESRGVGRRVGFWLGVVLFFGILLLVDLKPGEPLVTRMAAVAILMAVWWIADVIPLAATALLPLALYPLLGIMKGRDTAPIYVNYIIFLFVGGFMIALAMEKWNLHRRIALWIIRAVGGGPARLVLSFMLASAFLSMWISNTATTIMMLTIALAIISELEEAFGRKRSRKLTLAMLLGIAYGASIGGVATLVGTPPNLSFVRIFEIAFPAAEPIAFGQWMLLGLPLSAIMLVIVWLLLTRLFFRAPKDLVLPTEVIKEEYRRLGPIRFAETAVLVVFALTALMWVFRKDLALGLVTIPGWGNLLPFPQLIDDGTVAITMALLLFFIPSRATGEGESRMLLDVEVFRKVPWHIVLLFGGGFALASGFQTTGLSAFVGQQFERLEDTAPPVMIAAVSTTLTFLTELTSNTATTEMVLPILASAGTSMNINPLLLMIPATLSASCAFMLPVATPPNAIIFGSGRITVADMAKIGIVINLIGVAVITTVFYIIGTAVFSIDPGVLPDWAVVHAPP
ncbi:MAG: SLC13/DASS family transporter [Phycisphaerales bacterium]|nr:MAG: SLC13/DASS family transporter [Phycisphaerales bacterium]